MRYTPMSLLHTISVAMGKAGFAPIAVSRMSYSEEQGLTEFSSDHNFIVGTPITVGPSPARRPLVLNILADSLPWAIVREYFAEWMPNTTHFFARGMVFDQHFSVAEYTHPSLPSIETGMYPHHNQIFHDKITIPLRWEFVTLTEHMRDLDYATSNLVGDGIGGYNEVTRGYDRLIVTGYYLHTYEGVERTIRHLEGLRDTDLSMGVCRVRTSATSTARRVHSTAIWRSTTALRAWSRTS